jgi:hypothetical protein
LSVIVDAILLAIQGVLHGTFGELPTTPTLGLNTLAGTITGTSFFDHLGWLNSYWPVSESLDALGVLIGVIVIMFLVRILLWVATKLHLLGGSSD